MQFINFFFCLVSFPAQLAGAFPLDGLLVDTRYTLFSPKMSGDGTSMP